MTDRELLQMALNALEHYKSPDSTIKALRARLAQPEREWVGLTNEEIWKDDGIMAANSGYGANFETLRELARAIGTRLKEKNT